MGVASSHRRGRSRMNDTTRPAGNCGYSVWYVIERGQAVEQDPPVWWAGYTTVRGHEWTNDPRLGVRFPSRRAASRRLDEISGFPGIHHPMCHIEEYVFVDDPVLSKTDSGYWHARWNDNQWLQWPVGRKAVLSDGFGWITKEMVECANILVERESRNTVNQEPRDTQCCDFDQLSAEKSELAALRARVAELEADLDICMEALERLAPVATLGPVFLCNLGHFGESEIRLRCEVARKALRSTRAWQRAESEIDAKETTHEE